MRRSRTCVLFRVAFALVWGAPALAAAQEAPPDDSAAAVADAGVEPRQAAADAGVAPSRAHGDAALPERADDAADGGAHEADAGVADVDASAPAPEEADAGLGQLPEEADAAGLGVPAESGVTSEEEYAEDELYAEGAPLQTNDVVVTGERLIDPSEAPVESFSVSEEELERQQPISVNDVLRRVPGVTVTSEEGMGLRPNIGFRGLPGDRSRNVLVLEDGVPIAMMPYDYPEVYVAPRIERMRSVEVVRGAASIIYGPRTIGGVVNFVTRQPPPKLELKGEGRAGTGGYYFGYASGGDTIGRVGFLVTAMHQRFNGPRHLGLAQTDLMGRMTVDLRKAGELRLKLQFYDEDSHATNLGLTTTQYDAGRLDNFAYHDSFPIRRYAAQATHQIEFSRDVTLATTGYFNFTTRDWWRQDFLRKRADNVTYDRIIGPRGQTYPGDSDMGTNDGSSVFFLPSNVGRLRKYTVAGVEPRVTGRYHAGGMQGEVIGGARLHYEHAADRDEAGDSPTARSGMLLDKQSREVIAVSAYLRPTFEFFSQRLEIAPGVRVESIFSSVSVHRTVTTPGGIVDPSAPPYVYQPPETTSYDPPQTASNKLFAIIPGLGAVGRVNDWVAVFGGVHRGFVPPGIRDAIVGGGRNLQLKAEYAWNYELGVRGEPKRWLRYEATAFVIDYRRQVLSPNVANTGPDGQVPSGRSRSYGAELSGRLDLASAFTAGFELPVTVAYTYAQAHFGSGWAPGIKGNVVPYVPTSTLSARLDFAHPFGVEAQLSVNYLSSRFTDPYNSPDGSLDGTAGPIGAYTVVNARVAYNYKPWGTTVFFEARNLLDARYIASRAPAGIQPGMTRQMFAGVRVEY